MLPVQDRRFLGSMALAASFAFAQTQPVSSPQPKFILGTVEAVSGNVVYVNTDVQVVALTADGSTEVWKGKMFHDISQVAVDDDISARYRINAAGKLVAESVWLNIENVFGVITKTGENQFEIFTNPNADPQSGYKKENKMVAVDADTIFEESAKEDLKQGRNVQVVGLDLKNGTILATRISVYEGKRPVRMGNGRVILPNGQIR